MIAEFAELTGDLNPLHIEGGNRIAHGALVVGLLSAEIWRLWGDRAIIVNQIIHYLEPVRENDDLWVTFTPISTSGRVQHSAFSCWVRDDVVAHGTLAIKPAIKGGE
jgi:acyl dehydratase